ncbi:RNA polymerase sigma factor [Lentzea chajnantorensis]
MTSASPIAALVSAAAEGDQGAWNEIVDRYTPLVVSVIYKHRLRPADAADVNQTLWLRLVEQIGRLREPEALPGWIMTTTRNECLRVLRVQQRTHLYDPLSESDALESEQDADVEADLLAVERRQALRDGFAELHRAVQAVADQADDRPAAELPGRERRAGDAGRQHRADPHPLPGEAAQDDGDLDVPGIASQEGHAGERRCVGCGTTGTVTRCCSTPCATR